MRKFRLLLWLTGVLLVAAFTGGCGASVSKIKNEWIKESGRFRESKSFSSQRVEILARLLREAPTNVVEGEFRRLCLVEVPDGPNEAFDYDKTLLEALILNAVKRRDAARLSALLSANCPSHIGFIPLEFYVAQEWPGGFTVLFDSYAKAKSEHAKQGLMLCLGRAFGPLREQSRGNEQFVAAAERWYKENHEKANINQKYPHLGARPAWESMHADKNLFILK